MNNSVLVRTSQLQPDLRLAFHGEAKEYFIVWIVNLCLTLVTFGVYSAWAKVRKNRYFYSHTTLGDTPFEYLAKPLPILFGRIVAVFFFAIYYLSSNFYTPALPVVVVLALVLAPWVLVRSASFKARYSAWRNISFTFHGDYWSALRMLYAWGLIPLMAAGVMLHSDANDEYSSVLGALFLLFALVYPHWLCRLKRYMIDHYAFGEARGKLDIKCSAYYKVYLQAIWFLLVLFMLVLLGNVVVSQAGSWFDDAMSWLLHRDGRFSALPFIIISLVIFSIPYWYFLSIIKAGVSNQTWGHSTLGPVSFRSTMTPWGLTKLYMVNGIAIFMSLGLLIPWAVIRTLRYRIDNLQPQLTEDLDQVVAAAASPVRAAGAEVGDFFDMDLSL